MQLPLLFHKGSALIRGDSRVACNCVALALVSAMKGDYCWIEVRDPDSLPEAGEPSQAGAIPPDRLTLVRPESLRPTTEPADLPLWAAVRDDPASNELARLTDFLKLPQIVQEALHRRPKQPFTTMVVANGDRIAEFYADVDPMLIRAFFNLFRKLGVAVIATSTHIGPVDSTLFDIILRVEQGASRIKIEKGGPPELEGTEIPVGRHKLAGLIGS